MDAAGTDRTRDNIPNDVRRVISECLAYPYAKITNTMTLEHDLGADSLDKVEIVMALEEEF